jgi:hypothetical protein
MVWQRMRELYTRDLRLLAWRKWTVRVPGLKVAQHARRAYAHFGFRSSAADGTAGVGFNARAVLLPHDGTRHARVLLQGGR